MSVLEPALAPSATAEAGSVVEVRPAWRIIAHRLSWAAVVLALDLWSKAAVFAWLEPLRDSGRLPLHHCGLMSHPRYPLVGDWLAFMLSVNPGAAFGKFGDWPWLLVGGRCLAAVLLIWLIARTPPGRKVVAIGLVLILGGALGNLYDNLFLGLPHEGRPFGPVRDFIDVYFSGFDYHFATFNVADSCITVGAVLLVASGLFGTAHKGAPETPPPAAV